MKKIILMTAICALTNAAYAEETCTSITGYDTYTVGEACSNSTHNLYSTDECTSLSAGCVVKKCSTGCRCSKTCPSSSRPAECPTDCPYDDYEAVAGKDGYYAKCGDGLTTVAADTQHPIATMAISRLTCEAKCAPGYYGTALYGVLGFSGCTKCPIDPSSLLVSRNIKSALGSTSVSDCYIPSGTSFSDSTGSGTYTSDCHYQ